MVFRTPGLHWIGLPIPEAGPQERPFGPAWQPNRLWRSPSRWTIARVPPMTVLPPFPARRRGGAGNGFLSRQFLLMLCLGGGIGTFVAALLYVTKTAYAGLLPLGLALALPAAIVKNFRLYWFAVFLLSLQFLISKNLNDGLAVLDQLKIDYLCPIPTFEITATDLVLLILLGIWANDGIFHGKPMRFPAVTWLAVGYLAICLISTLRADSRYLGLVELSRQLKFFIVYLFAVNCLDSKSALRVLVAVGVVILVTQAAVTVVRFETGYITPLTFGDTHQDLSKLEKYLEVDRSIGDSATRGFGTMGSPNETIRLCLMFIPFALFLSVPNAMFRRWLLVATLTAAGLGGLVLTFTRLYYIVAAVQGLLAFLIMIRDRLLKREVVILTVMLGLAGATAASPWLYKQFTIRDDSVSTRLLQDEMGMRMIRANPVFGVGLNNGTREAPKYVNVTYSWYDAETQFYMEPINNFFISMMAEIGIPGSVLFVAFFTGAASVAWRQSRGSADPEIRLAANALVVLFCSLAVYAWMDPILEYPVLTLLWLYAGISLNLPRMAQGQAPLEPKTLARSTGSRTHVH